MQPVAPSITDPTSDIVMTVTEGNDVAFTVTAMGTDPITYQWQLKKEDSWQDIPDATSACYTVSSVNIASDGSRYRCIATNSVGSATSPTFTLKILSTDVPPTGDNSSPWFWGCIGFIAFICLCVTVIVLKRKEKIK